MGNTILRDAAVDVSEAISLDRTRLQWTLGYVLSDSVALQFFGSWQNTLGGLQFDAATKRDIANHDQLALAEADLVVLGGAVSFPVGNAIDLWVEVNDIVWRVNNHDARAVTIGMSWGFSAFGGIGG